jgi:two-component system cell cycle response regulator DivK
MKRILIVDDNEMNRVLIQDILALRDCEVFEAVDGRQALDLAQKVNPDLIFMDIQLPVLDGITATRMLKENPETAGIPVVALTSYAFEKDHKAFTAAGGAMFVSKPLVVNELLEVIDGI